MLWKKGGEKISKDCLRNSTSLRRYVFQHSQENHALTQWAFTCSNLTIETVEQGVKYVQS